jgi:hypothetical protein
VSQYLIDPTGQRKPLPTVFQPPSAIDGATGELQIDLDFDDAFDVYETDYAAGGDGVPDPVVEIWSI